MAKLIERPFEGKGITLNGAEASPKNPRGTVHFVYGISANWKDYAPFLEQLSEHFRVCIYNQRGHADSPGSFDLKGFVDDLEHVVERESRPVGIIGHSLGCHTAVQVAKRFENKGVPVQGIYLIEPYLGPEFLPLPMRFAVYALRAFAPLLSSFDAWLNSQVALREKNGLNNRDVLRSFGDLAKVRSRDYRGLRTPVGYMQASSDEVLGGFANYPRLQYMFPQGVDDCAFATGLNHCLNVKQGDFKPFFKPEETSYPAHPKSEIMESVVAFLDYVFGNSRNEKH